MARILPALLVLGLAGCMSAPWQSPLVPSNPFTSLIGGSSQNVVAPPGTTDASLRVLQIGQTIVKANPQLDFKPIFSTIGNSNTANPSEEIFHRGNDHVFITESLISKCKTDGQLAAALCMELAKIAEEHGTPSSRFDNDGPPQDVPIGSDTHSLFGPADGTRAAELARYDQTHHRGYHIAADPKIVARSFLTHAGYPSADFDAALPLLQSAEQHATLEKQMTR